MRVLISATGAILAAMLEASVLTQLQPGGLKPDLVFALGVAVAMVLGFGSGLAWAFTGGIMLDMLLPERALGSTALVLLAVIGLALLVARATWPPRLVLIAVSALCLTFLYQALLLALLALSTGIEVTPIAMTTLLGVAILNTVIALLGAMAVRALEVRFSEPERQAW